LINRKKIIYQTFALGSIRSKHPDKLIGSFPNLKTKNMLKFDKLYAFMDNYFGNFSHSSQSHNLRDQL